MATVSVGIRPGEWRIGGRLRGYGFCGVPERVGCRVHGARFRAGGQGIERGGLGCNCDRPCWGREEWVVATWSGALRRIARAVRGTGATLEVLRGCGALCRDVRGWNGLLWRFLGGLPLRDAAGQVSC